MAPKAQPATPKATRSASEAASGLVLPLLVVGPVDIGRLIRELEALDNLLLQMELRGSAGQTNLPKTSQLLEETVTLNQLNLLQAADRKRLQTLLTAVKEHAPLLHISFSADPTPAFTERLMAWLRREIHPNVLMTIGLQPNIGAGCIVRGLNHQFDLSLRQDFIKQRGILLQALTAEGNAA